MRPFANANHTSHLTVELELNLTKSESEFQNAESFGQSSLLRSVSPAARKPNKTENSIEQPHVLNSNSS